MTFYIIAIVSRQDPNLLWWSLSSIPISTYWFSVNLLLPTPCKAHWSSSCSQQGSSHFKKGFYMEFLHLGILFCHIVTWLAPHFNYISTKMPPLLRSLPLLFNKKFPLPTHPPYPLTLLYFTHSTSYYLISYIFLRPYINWFCFGFFFWSFPPLEGSHQKIENLIAFFNSISAPWTAHNTKKVNNGCWKKAIKEEERRK